ncbi:sensor histidine kinase [Gemmiger sp.]|uniref:sensor histidine kinase n=1 Tax=Gemmiger sp. TaxID=2049027 RepID=UPI003AB8AAA9
MTDENTQKQPLSMTRRYRRGLILTGVLCVLAMLTAATLLFQRSYVERVDSYIAQICDGYAAAYKAQDTHDAMSFAAMLPEESARTLRFTLIDADGTVLFDSKTSALVYDSTNTLYAVMDSNLPNHADRPEFRRAMEKGSASLTRESETMQTETHYYALRIDTPDGTQVLRVGEDIANIWGLSADTLPLLCAAVVLILLAATLFSWWLTRRMVQPINHLAEHLDTIEADVPYEELIPLARTIQTDRKLREDNETMRREFTANVSHELKTPLTSISGYAELIETGMAKAEDIPTFAARIHKEAQRMIALVSDILQLSELDSNQASRTREAAAEAVPVDLAALVKETAQNMTVNARRAYVTLQYDARPATVQGCRDQLSELTQNLCDNAIRYNRPGGHVELRCGVGSDGCPYFEVEDNGIGIPQDSQTRVFERFYRVDKSRSKATGGTGLGLAIVKHIALLHDARIDLQSQVGTGTTIRVTFPKNP